MLFVFSCKLKFPATVEFASKTYDCVSLEHHLNYRATITPVFFRNDDVVWLRDSNRNDDAVGIRFSNHNHDVQKLTLAGILQWAQTLPGFLRR